MLCRPSYVPALCCVGGTAWSVARTYCALQRATAERATSPTVERRASSVCPLPSAISCCHHLPSPVPRDVPSYLGRWRVPHWVAPPPFRLDLHVLAPVHSAPSRPHCTSERAGGLGQAGISSRLGPVLRRGAGWEGTLCSSNVPCPCSCQHGAPALSLPRPARRRACAPARRHASSDPNPSLPTPSKPLCMLEPRGWAVFCFLDAPRTQDLVFSLLFSSSLSASAHETGTRDSGRTARPNLHDPSNLEPSMQHAPPPPNFPLHRRQSQPQFSRGGPICQDSGQPSWYIVLTNQNGTTPHWQTGTPLAQFVGNTMERDREGWSAPWHGSRAFLFNSDGPAPFVATLPPLHFAWT